MRGRYSGRLTDDPATGADPRSARTVDKNGSVRPVHQSAAQAPPKFASTFHRAIEDSIEPLRHPWGLTPTLREFSASHETSPSWVCYGSMGRAAARACLGLGRLGSDAPISMLPWSARQALDNRSRHEHTRPLRHEESDISGAREVSADPVAWRRPSPSPWQTYSSLGLHPGRSLSLPQHGKAYQASGGVPQRVSGWALYSSLAAGGEVALIEEVEHNSSHKITQKQRNRNEGRPGSHLVENKAKSVENDTTTRRDDEPEQTQPHNSEPSVCQRGLFNHTATLPDESTKLDAHLGALSTAVTTDLLDTRGATREERHLSDQTLHESGGSATDTIGRSEMAEMSLWDTPAIVASLNDLEGPNWHLARPQSQGGYRATQQDDDKIPRPRDHLAHPGSGMREIVVGFDEFTGYSSVDPQNYGAHSLDVVSEIKVTSLDLILEESQDLSGFVSYGRLRMNAEQALDDSEPLRDLEHRTGKSRDVTLQDLERTSPLRESGSLRRDGHSDTIAQQVDSVKVAMPYDDNTWYHVTDESRLPQIQQQGLVGSEQGTDRVWGEHPVEENAVYLHPNIGAAWAYADTYGKGNEHTEQRWQKPVILRAQGIERGNLAPDHEQVGGYIDRLRDNLGNDYDLSPIEDELLNWVKDYESQTQRPTWSDAASSRFQHNIDMLRAMPPELREFAASEVSRYGGDSVMHYGPIGAHQLEVGRAMPVGEGFDEDAWEQWATENPREWTEEERDRGDDFAAYDQWLGGQPYLNQEDLDDLHNYSEDPEDDSLTHRFEWTPLQQYRTSSADDPDKPHENAWTDEERQKFQDQMAQHGEMYDDEMAPRVTPKIDIDYEKSARNLYERLLRNDPRDPINSTAEKRQFWIEYTEWQIFRTDEHNAEAMGLTDLRDTFRADFGGPYKYGATNPINYSFIPLTSYELHLFDSLPEPERKTWRDRASNLNRRGQKIGEPNRVSGRELYALMMRHDGNCAYCDKTLNWGGGGTADWSTGEDSRNFPLREGDPASGTFDHNHPLNQGGSGGAENILPACWRCNSDLNQWDRRENPPEPRKYEENPMSYESSEALASLDSSGIHQLAMLEPHESRRDSKVRRATSSFELESILRADSRIQSDGFAEGRLVAEVTAPEHHDAGSAGLDELGPRRVGRDWTFYSQGLSISETQKEGKTEPHAFEHQDNPLQEALPEFDDKTTPHTLGSRNDPGLPWRVYSEVDLELNDARQTSPVSRLATDSQRPERRPTNVEESPERDHAAYPEDHSKDDHHASIPQRRLGINDGFQAAPGMKLVYKGIPLGTMGDEEVEWSIRNLRQVVEQQAITWTRPTEGWSEYASAAYNWAMNRDSEGWALEGEEDDERFDVGVVLEGEAPLGSTMPEEDERAYDAVWFDQGSTITMLFAYFYWVDRETGDEEFQKIPMGESHMAKSSSWSSVPELVQKVRGVIDRAYDPDFSKGFAPDSRDLIHYATEVLSIQLSLSDEEELGEQLYEWECNAPSPFTQGLESLITDGLQPGSTVPNAEIAGNAETETWELQQAKFVLDIIEAQVERRRTNGNY